MSQRAIRAKLDCPLCRHSKSTVVPRTSRRVHGDSYDRVRECRQCGCWYQTTEQRGRIVRHPRNKPTTSSAATS
jgi:transcriptional regulator NrdR family protein